MGKRFTVGITFSDNEWYRVKKINQAFSVNVAIREN